MRACAFERSRQSPIIVLLVPSTLEENWSPPAEFELVPLLAAGDDACSDLLPGMLLTESPLFACCLETAHGTNNSFCPFSLFEVN